jgi:cell division protein FtsA
MTRNPHIVTALDIGTSQTKIVITDMSDPSRHEVIGVGVAPSRGLRKGVVINIDNTIAGIQQALKQAESMAGIEVSSVYCSLSGAHIKGLSSNGVVAIKHKEVRIDDVERVIEAAKAVAIPMDREVLHVLPQEFIVDDQDSIKDPVGIHGVRLEARVHMITGAVASAENIVKCANRCGLTVNDVVSAGIASGRAVVTDEEQDLGVCVIDIGGGTTDVTVFHNGAVKHSFVLPVGGNHISNDIALLLRTPIEAAEELKCLHGCALPSLIQHDETLSVTSTGEREDRVLSKQWLAEIIEPRLTEIFQVVIGELINAKADQLIHSGIVLTGGVANQVGIAELAESVFSAPVRVGFPRGAQGLSDLIKDPAHAASFGLVLYGDATKSTSRASQGRGNFLSHSIKKVANWFGEHF